MDGLCAARMVSLRAHRIVRLLCRPQRSALEQSCTQALAAALAIIIMPGVFAQHQSSAAPKRNMCTPTMDCVSRTLSAHMCQLLHGCLQLDATKHGTV